MRHVTKPVALAPPEFSEPSTLALIQSLAETGNKDLIDDKLYRLNYSTPDGQRSHVEDHLALAYEFKCAYCERICKADIEHYRPKKSVSDENGHNGYYWLTYEWSNLMPACINCNREGAKHNRFPILGPRVYSPSMLADGKLDFTRCAASGSPLVDERPLLLHPEVDEPSGYFQFEIDPAGAGIRMVGVDVEGRGARTIEICKLNRHELKLDRAENVIGNFVSAIEGTFALLSMGDISLVDFKGSILTQLRTLIIFAHNPSKSHTLLRKYIIRSRKNFTDIVLPYCSIEVQDIIMEAFDSIEDELIAPIN